MRRLAFALLASIAVGCSQRSPSPEGRLIKSVADANPELEARSALFHKEIVSPAPGIHVAIGYGLANSILVEGEGGVFVVDTLESRSTATEALSAFRAQVPDKPIEAVVLTHNHADHVFGGLVFTGEEDIPVYAHETTQAQIDRLVNLLSPIIQVRSQRMFGEHLDDAGLVNCGIGERLRFSVQDMALARPNHTYADHMEVELAGVKAELLHIPGETDDQTAVWLPERRVLMPGDDVYQAFPNLYTIRGTPYRDVLGWVSSLDRLIALNAEVLVPSHGRPLVGADAIRDVLTAYRDAIQFVHDQTVRGMNKGLDPDELAEAIHLPPHLANHPWLKEVYGRVPWSVRSIYSGYLGWYDGHIASLEPLPPAERARRLAAAMAKGEPIGQQTQAALDAGDFQWAAELAEVWTRAEPDSREARGALAQAGLGLAKGHPNPSARHWFLTRAAELKGDLVLGPPPTETVPLDFIDRLPMASLFASLPVRLHAEDALDADFRADFHFGEDAEAIRVHIRRGVAIVGSDLTGPADLTIRTSARVWRRVITRHMPAAEAVASSQLEIEGDLTDLLTFLRWFREE